MSMDKPLNILSLGAGVQSTTVLLMSCLGELPKLDCAIFADTQSEPKEVYKHLDWLQQEAGKYGVDVRRVTRGNLREDALKSQVSGKKIDGKRWASMPLRTLRNWGTSPDDERELKDAIAQYEASHPGKEASKLRKILRSVERGQLVKQEGMIKRQCTKEYKIEPIERLIKTEFLGLSPKDRWPTKPVVRHWFGISRDEINRVRRPVISKKRGKPKPILWKSNYYPLVGWELWHNRDSMDFPTAQTKTRQGCAEWLASHGFPVAPRSACNECPFRGNSEWRHVRDTSPDEWQRTIEFDRAIRNCGGMRGEAYLHKSLVPLELAVIDPDPNQRELFENETCDGGHCFV